MSKKMFLGLTAIELAAIATAAYFTYQQTLLAEQVNVSAGQTNQLAIMASLIAMAAL